MSSSAGPSTGSPSASQSLSGPTKSQTQTPDQEKPGSNANNPQPFSHNDDKDVTIEYIEEVTRKVLEERLKAFPRLKGYKSTPVNKSLDDGRGDL